MINVLCCFVYAQYSEVGTLLRNLLTTFIDSKYAASTIREKAKGVARSSSWSSVRAQHLRHHPSCAVCNKTKSVHVHHEVPFNIDPSKELEPTNLITLCAKHHLTFGHLGYWKSYNVHVREDCYEWNRKYVHRP